MAPRSVKGQKPQPKPPEVPKECKCISSWLLRNSQCCTIEPSANFSSTDPTIAAKLEAEYLASRPYQVLKDAKGLSNLTPNEKAAYINYRFLETGAVEQQKIPFPLPKPKDLGKDSKGRDIGTLTPEEYKLFQKKQSDLQALKEKSERNRELVEEDTGAIEDERSLRKLIGVLQGKKMGRYEGDPEWDDVVPIPQDDGEGALAQIAYTDEYAEGELCISFPNISDQYHSYELSPRGNGC
jgi:protein farnesyltransferase/geranylgeranyltransferase type-1 subunit alpha